MKKLGMKISGVENGSIGDELGLKIGDKIITINGEMPLDIIEYSFLIQEEELELHVEYKNGDEQIIELEKDFEDDLGLSFENAVFDHIRPCANKCIFCFVDGQPKGLRESLYVKDDDWRLSYLQGTYVTLTNFTKKDWEKLEKLRLSPLYISIHTTNPTLRVEMLKNPNAAKIMENLERLKKLNIAFHAQIVLCPKYNEGKELERTLNDLKKFKKNLLSLAIVPVGISKYHINQLEPVDKAIAIDTINKIENFNLEMKKNIAMASDEIFLTAQVPIPNKKYYGKFHQIEDGVGAIRLYLDDFEKQKTKLKAELKKPSKLTLATGSVAFELFSKIKNEINVKGLEVNLIEVKNEFFGDRITVAGLICGQDIIKTLQNQNEKIENLIIPSVMLKEGSNEFLDGTTTGDIEGKFNTKIFIIKNCHSFAEFVAIINSL